MSLAEVVPNEEVYSNAIVGVGIVDGTSSSDALTVTTVLLGKTSIHQFDNLRAKVEEEQMSTTPPSDDENQASAIK